MTLLDRIRTCNYPGCQRRPAGPTVTRCDEHRERWLPAWRRNLVAKDLSRSAA